MTRSRPAASARPQLVPNGPRMPITVPGCASCSARLTAPTERIVWVMVPSATVGSPLTEIAISPIPNAYIIMNSPGCGARERFAHRFQAQRRRVAVLGDTAADPVRHRRSSPTAAPASVAVSVIASILFARKQVQRVHLLGDVNPGGTPGDTAPAAHAAGCCRTGRARCRACGSSSAGIATARIAGRCLRART